MGVSVDTAPESVHGDLLNYLCRAADAADDDLKLTLLVWRPSLFVFYMDIGAKSL